jgi:hypothetical protein
MISRQGDYSKNVRFTDVACGAQGLKILFHSLPTILPSENVVNMQNGIRIFCWAITAHFKDARIADQDFGPQPPIDF